MNEKSSLNVILSPAGRAHGLAEHTHPTGDRSQCEFCRNNRDFSMPRQLYDTIAGRDVVLFAGAGVSTEGNPVAVPSLYEQVCSELKLDPNEGVSFPDVMARYCNELGTRGEVLRLIKSHLTISVRFPNCTRSQRGFIANSPPFGS